MTMASGNRDRAPTTRLDLPLELGPFTITETGGGICVVKVARVITTPLVFSPTTPAASSCLETRNRSAGSRSNLFASCSNCSFLFDRRVIKTVETVSFKVNCQTVGIRDLITSAFRVPKHSRKVL